MLFFLSSFAEAVNAFSNPLDTWLTLIPLVTFSLGVDSRSKSLLIPEAESPSAPPLCSVPSSILTLKLAIDSLHGKILAEKIVSFSPLHLQHTVTLLV